MSQTLEAPRGLDTMSADDIALLNAMREETEPPGNQQQPEPQARAPAPAAPPASDPGAELEIELPDDTPAPAARQPRTDMVPHAQFHAVSEERKALKAANKEAADRLAAAETARQEAERKAHDLETRTQERINMLLALAQQPVASAPAPVADATPTPPAEEALPDINTDPLGYVTARLDRQAKEHKAEMDAMKGVVNGLTERQREGQTLADLRTWATAQEVAFMEREPSYADAMKHYRASFDGELQDIGIIDPNQRAQIINNNVTAAATRARQEGGDFAERLYKAAVRRGFQKAAPAPAPAVDTEAVSAAALRAARVAEGVNNSTSIGSVGAAPATRMSVERILALPDDQFEAVYTRMKAAGRLAELMGE